MITVRDRVFNISTKNTSYICQIREDRFLENLYYGRRISLPQAGKPEGIRAKTDEAIKQATGAPLTPSPRELVTPLTERYSNQYGNTVVASDHTNMTLDNLCQDFSQPGVGDYRPTSVLLRAGDTYSGRFYFTESYLYEGLYKQDEETKMPYARYATEGSGTDTLELLFTDEAAALELRLIYTAFEDCDVIVRRTVLTNKSDSSIRIRNLASMQLDLPGTAYTLLTFDGIWTRERHTHEKRLESGTYVTESTVGTSSNRHNPFIMLRANDATEHNGDCYAFNLIYSGNHKEVVDVSEYNQTRIITGINDWCLDYELKSGETFYTPEAMLTYSHQGLNGASHHCHDFVTDHIIPEQFRGKDRPILVNNWEATYFDFDRHKLISLARDAGKLGIELFVLDDGWFGHRDDDSSSLGDWKVNEDKLGGSLSSLIADIKREGLDFGIWVEPEMVSEDSDLYRAHPDWAISVPGRDIYRGRNQLVLDYTRAEVRDYIVEQLDTLLGDNAITYVKWDMNRHLTDAYSAADTDCGAFYHAYVLGYYDVMRRLTEAHPQVLFEGCSSGGNRFDLGVLFYMPQIWTSDDTDAHERMTIQRGTSYGYPQSTMGAHVSASPNHQTLRSTSIDTRFQVACMGAFGYELDLTRLTPSERKAIRSQVDFYKEHRHTLQFGRFDRVRREENLETWQATAADGSEAIALVYQPLSEPNRSDDRLFATGLDPDGVYRVKGRQVQVSIKSFGNLVNTISPINIKEEGVLQAMVDRVYSMDSECEEYVVTGSMLMYAGIRLNSRFVGTGLGEGTRTMGDYSSRLYVITRL